MCMEYLRWAKGVLMDPKRSTKKDIKYREFSYRLALLSLVSGVMSTVVTAMAFMTELSEGADAVTWSSVFVMVPIYLIGAVVGPFVSGAITHFFGKFVFRFMKGKYKSTYNAAAYSTVPKLLFAWIPVVGGIISGIWSIVVGVYALMNQQKISMGKALIVTFVPIAIAFVIAAIAVLASLDGMSLDAPELESV